ncbi:MAG: hypothetical protein SV765_10935 [Pseudomonadota bacterium]|nr:hypothetical protein [Pseudomonadota bacterium]
MDIPIILDIEASGFGTGSYPIEIGVAMPDGTLHVWLIRPLAHWTHWQASAEQVHGISREQLLEQGRSPREVADELNELLAGQVVYSDGWGVDRTWLALLFHEAGVLQGFKLDTIYGLLAEAELNQWSGEREEVLRLTGMVQHRAGTDAMVIQKTFIHLKNPQAELETDAGPAGTRKINLHRAGS